MIGPTAETATLGAPARLEQPVGEVAALPQLRDGQIDRARSGCPRPCCQILRKASCVISSASWRFPVTSHNAPKSFERFSSKNASKPSGTSTPASSQGGGPARTRSYPP
jgi:hypothetical protein